MKSIIEKFTDQCLACHHLARNLGQSVTVTGPVSDKASWSLSTQLWRLPK